MIHTTLNKIRARGPCGPGWEHLLRGLGKSGADCDPLGFDEILRICGVQDALWCLRAEPQHDRLWRAVAVRIARTVQHLMRDPRSLAALDVAERWAHGLASDDEQDAATGAAFDASVAIYDGDGAAIAQVFSASAAYEAADCSPAVGPWVAAMDAAKASGLPVAQHAAWTAYGEILLSAVSAFDAAPGELGVRVVEVANG